MTLNNTVSSIGFQDYSTPKYLMDAVNSIWPIGFDLAASEHNTKHKNFYSVDDDAFSHDWAKTQQRYCRKKFMWLNSPFCGPKKKCKSGCNKEKCIKRGFHDTIDQPGQRAWVKKCVGNRIVNLTLASRGSRWYREIVRPNALSLLLGKRIIFENEKAPYTKELMLNIFGTGQTGEGYFDF